MLNLYNELKEVRERCVKSFLDVIIASILANKPSWGYEIIANIHEKLHILLSPGAIYPVLYSMERKGLIVKHNGDGVRKRFYEITEEGRRWLREMLSASRYVYGIPTVFAIRDKKILEKKIYPQKLGGISVLLSLEPLEK